MAWTYSDYNSRTLYPSDQSRRDRLALHVQEVIDKQGGRSGVSGAGMSVQFTDQYLARLQAELQMLSDRVDRFGSGRGPLSVANTNGVPR